MRAAQPEDASQHLLTGAKKSSASAKKAIAPPAKAAKQYVARFICAGQRCDGARASIQVWQIRLGEQPYPPGGPLGTLPGLCSRLPQSSKSALSQSSARSAVIGSRQSGPSVLPRLASTFQLRCTSLQHTLHERIFQASSRACHGVPSFPDSTLPPQIHGATLARL